jgi:threonine/homoserine/homoserine lactone efflux protein
MEPAQLWAFVVFSLVGSFTPGPNNTIATATAANFGFRAALPHIFGVPFGLSTMLALGSLGAMGLLFSLPTAAGAVKWAGIAYLVYLGWLLMRAARTTPDRASATPAARPLTFLESALFQYANPKAWMLAAATVGTYMSGRDVAMRAALICMVFSATCIASLAVWAWMGAALRAWLRTGRRRWWFNAAMGLSLAATALWMAVTT